MGKTLYLECYSGISGDMTVAALLDLGADRSVLDRVLKSLKVSGFETKISRVVKSGIDACDFDVVLDKEHENHDHDMEYLHGHDHDMEHDHDHEHAHDTEHHHDHEHTHAAEHHHHDHEGHHHADEVFTSWGRETIKKYTKENLEKMLEALSASDEYGIILRAKGMLPAEDGTWIYFDMVPEETEIREGAPEYTGRLCVIGSKLKEDKLAELFGL